MKRSWKYLTLGILAAACMLQAIPPAHAGEIQRRQPGTHIEDALVGRITQHGLDYIALLLEKGLEADDLRGDIVNALEGQTFEILMPQLGGYAVITVDYGEGRSASHLDGFRYDDVSVELSSIPLAPRVIPESGVIYPALYLNRYLGDLLPELHVYISYDPFIPASTPISAVAEAILVTSGILRPSFAGGDFRIEAADFETNVYQMNIKAWSAFPPGISDQEDEIKEALGNAVLEGMNKEVNDALSDVFMSGINDILFDRDQDGEPDKLLSVEDLIAEVNAQFDSDFSFTIDSVFQSNPVTPPEVYMRFDTSMDSGQQGECFGPDVVDGMRYTLLEQDGNQGHDPTVLLDTLEDGTPYQFGLSLSDDFLNNVLFSVYNTGRLCLSLGPDMEGMPDELSELFNTNSFAAFPQGQWLKELAPDAPVSFEIIPYQAPYIVFPNTEAGDDDLAFVLPGAYLNVYAKINHTWLRVVGYDAKITASVDWKGIDLEEPPFLQFDIDFASYTLMNFGELAVDAERSDVESLFPLLIDIGGSQLNDFLGSVEFDLIGCIDGVDVSEFELVRSGTNTDSELAHYLQFYMSLDGVMDLGYLLGECLLGGESLVAPGWQQAGAEQTARFVVTEEYPLVLAHAQAYPVAYTVNGVGPVSWHGPLAVSHFMGGTNTVQALYPDGTERTYQVIVDQTPPGVAAAGPDQVQLSETVQADDLHWVQYDATGQSLHAGYGTGTVRWVKGAALMVVRNAAGLQTEYARPLAADSGAGCAATRGGNSFVLALLLWAWALSGRKKGQDIFRRSPQTRN